jgi:hypothetical protein
MFTVHYAAEAVMSLRPGDIKYLCYTTLKPLNFESHRQ